jgi:hypothetical protein
MELESLKTSLFVILLFSFNSFAEGEVCLVNEITGQPDTSKIEKLEKGTCLESYNASAKRNEQKYETKICKNGKFELDINIHFNEESVKSVFDKYFLNSNKLMESNHLVNSLPVFKTINPANVIKKMNLEKASKKDYTLTSTVKKNFFSSEIETICSVSTENKVTKQICKITNTNGGTKFNHAYTNQTQITCTKTKGFGVDCKVKVQGKANKITFKNNNDIACAGAVETIKNFAHLSYLSYQCNSNINKTSFFKDRTDPYYKVCINNRKDKLIKGDKSNINKVSSISDSSFCKSID